MMRAVKFLIQFAEFEGERKWDDCVMVYECVPGCLRETDCSISFDAIRPW